MKKNLLPIAFLGLAFSGCGDDVTKTTVNETTGIAQLAKGEAFPECASENTGEMLFAADSGAVYYCADGKWQTLKGESGEDGESCKVELLSDSTGYKVLCNGDSVGVVLNGAKGDAGKEGAKGENGKPGENGESCAAETLENGAGYKIVCGNDSVGVVLNGLDGKDGINGEKGEKGENGTSGKDGIGCTLSDEGNGSVNVICAADTVKLYKAVCGTEPYDPAKSFCLHDQLYAIKENSFVATENLNQEMLAAGKYGYLIDTRDSQIYRTIQIGSQTWMAQNLNYAYNEGSAKSYCYDDNAENCEKYGRLYIWSAAMDSAAVFSEDGRGCGYFADCTPADTVQGVCPKGWHLPSEAEFEILRNAVGGEDIAGKKLKSTSDWLDEGNVTDDFGFSALPAGYRRSGEGSFSRVGLTVVFFSATASRGDEAYIISLSKGGDGAALSYGNKNFSFSVRCLRDSGL